VKGRKLLVASIGVATVSYVGAASSVASCGGTGTSQVGDGGGKDELQIVGNLAPACTADSTVVCTATAAAGVACPGGGVTPGQTDPRLACTAPTPSSPGTDTFCCVPWVAGTSSSCTPVSSAASTPCAANTYPFQCPPGSSPDSVDTTFHCAAPVTGPSGLDYVCCTHD
jgi:hypothetical protein